MKNESRACISHYDLHQSSIKKLDNLTSVRELLSSFLSVNDFITFRKNTTSVILDIIQTISCTDSEYTLVISDLEHPCIQHAVRCFFKPNKIIFLKLYDLLLTGKIDEIEEEISKTYNSSTIHFFSHVLWNCGVALDVESISTKIKKKNPCNIVMVDGAQAVGNLNLSVGGINQTVIDVYVGCTHKWLGTRELLGFAVLSKSMMQNKNVISQIFLKDIFSSFAGNIKELEWLDWNLSTYDVTHLLKITKGLNMIIPNYVYQSNIWNSDVVNRFGLKFVSGGESGCFTGFYGEKNIVEKACSELNLSVNCIVEDALLPKGYSWLRV